MALITEREFFDFYQQTTGTDQRDVTLANLVADHVSAWLETYLGRKLARATYTQHDRPHAPQRQILLKNAPVSAVTSVSEGTTTLSTSDWNLDDGDLGVIWFERPLVVGRRYTIEYTGGYDPLPEDINGLLLRQSAIAFKRTKDQSWELESTDTDTNSGVSVSERLTNRSASRTIRRLYSALNRRRVALSATSGSGPAPFPSAESRPTPVALRAPSVARDSFSSSGLITNTGYLPSRPAH